MSAFLLGALTPVPAGIRVSPLDVYGEAVADGRIPYRDFALEYPPGALPPIVVPALLPSVEYEVAFRCFEALLGVLLVVCTAYLLRAASRAELILGTGLVALLPVLLGPVVFFRFDLWPSLLVSGALVSLERSRVASAGALIGIAAAAKLYAAALAPPLVSVVDRDQGNRAARRALVSLLAGLLVTLPLALVAPGGVASSLERQLDRPLQLETVGATALLVLGDPTVEFASGAWSLTGSVPELVGAVSTTLGLVALAAVWVAAWTRRRHVGAPALVYAACIALVLVSAKVASPQFIVWLAPLVAVVRGRSGVTAVLLLAAACVLTQLLYPVRYEELIAGEALPVALLAARNALLLGVALVLVVALARRLQGKGVPQ